MPPVHQQGDAAALSRLGWRQGPWLSRTVTGCTTCRSTFHAGAKHRIRKRPRRLLGLDPQPPCGGCTGRPVDIKWRNLLVDMVPPLLREVPEAQLVFVGATPSKIRRLRRLRVLDRCTLLEPTLDEDRLAAFYAACDVFVSASEIGEAQGMANLEAMAFGVPVVTCSMPWADNAQVEFVEHGRTGLIANHPRPFAEAVAALLLDAGLRHRLGSGGEGDRPPSLRSRRPGAPARAALHEPGERGPPAVGMDARRRQRSTRSAPSTPGAPGFSTGRCARASASRPRHPGCASVRLA